MRSARFPAMGTEVHVLVPDSPLDHVALVCELFEEWEARLSRFRPESELSRLNARAGAPVVVSELVFRVVAEAVQAARATAGAFDPTLLHDLVRAGYDRSFDTMPAHSLGTGRLPSGGGAWRSIGLDPGARIVELPAGCALDLGGIAKGMAVDAALDLLQALGVHSALVSAGGDLAVRGLPRPHDAWQVLVGERRDQVVPLVRGALATSGIGRRSWRQGSRARHHILDPETGEPAESGIREVTVAAGSCGRAEAAATGAFVLGAGRGASFLLEHGLAGRFTHLDGTQSSVGTWPAPSAVAA